MNKLFIATGMAALGSAIMPTARTAGVDRSFLQRCFKYLHHPRASRLNADPAAGVDSQLVDEKDWQSDKQQSPLYDLAANNPYVVAASLFSRKHK
ncbi:MAG: hypothetical protein WCC12_13215 [Anaerolineales bacterium]